ncbi:MAG: squalene/phytoene synthase family protein [Hyphomicrobiaceae bacterium]|nr:squalene/phytoene synthase family protein [Hyphomicrobiaceae bacterium]
MKEDDREIITGIARAHALDYYLSALLAPRKYRDDLLVLAAFEAEIDRIPRQVTDPMVAEIRLQWWRDWIDAMEPGSASGNPVADHLAEVATRHRLDKERLIASVDARSTLDAEPTPFILPGGVRARLRARDFAAMLRAANVMGAFPQGPDYEALEAAGLAVSFAQVAQSTRTNVGKVDGPHMGQILNLKSEMQMARQNLALLRQHARSWSPRMRLAALPAALVEPYLRACERGAGQDATEEQANTILPMTRVWRLWWTARTGRF